MSGLWNPGHPDHCEVPLKRCKSRHRGKLCLVYLGKNACAPCWHFYGDQEDPDALRRALGMVTPQMQYEDSLKELREGS